MFAWRRLSLVLITFVCMALSLPALPSRILRKVFARVFTRAVPDPRP